MELGFFEHVGEVARSGIDASLGTVHQRAHRGGVKIWFGDEKAAREHYEAQLVAGRHVGGSDGLVLEIGFHAEHRDAARNEQALAGLLAASEAWRETLGEVTVSPEEIVHDVVVADHFLGNDSWRRVSETWTDPDLEDTELSFEAGARLADYVNALQPIIERGG